MRKLSNSLKQILTGLAYQDVGEFLSMKDKINVPEDTETQAANAWQTRNRNDKAKNRRIALITDGKGVGAALEYAIDVSRLHGTQIDLLTRGCS
jgi:hypothetical protein